MIRSELSSLMANYSKIKIVGPPWSHITRKLESGEVRRHRRGKGKNREAKERGSKKAR